jgi:hypothetical protein
MRDQGIESWNKKIQGFVKYKWIKIENWIKNQKPMRGSGLKY